MSTDESLCENLLADSATVMEKELVHLWQELERVHQEVIRQLADVAEEILRERPGAGPALEERLRRMAANCEANLRKAFARGKDGIEAERRARDAAIREFCNKRNDGERGSTVSAASTPY